MATKELNDQAYQAWKEYADATAATFGFAAGSLGPVSVGADLRGGTDKAIQKFIAYTNLKTEELKHFKGVLDS